MNGLACFFLLSAKTRRDEKRLVFAANNVGQVFIGQAQNVLMANVFLLHGFMVTQFWIYILDLYCFFLLHGFTVTQFWIILILWWWLMLIFWIILILWWW